MSRDAIMTTSLAVSDTVLISAVTVTGQVVLGLGLALIAWLQQRSARKAEKATELVKETLAQNTQATDGKLAGLADVAAKTHLLVNSAMAAALKSTAVALRRIAEITKDPADLQAAEVAELASGEHAVKQAAVDATDRGWGP